MRSASEFDTDTDNLNALFMSKQDGLKMEYRDEVPHRCNTMRLRLRNAGRCLLKLAVTAYLFAVLLHGVS